MQTGGILCLTHDYVKQKNIRDERMVHAGAGEVILSIDTAEGRVLCAGIPRMRKPRTTSGNEWLIEGVKSYEVEVSD